jgi:tetratricopeptide (TPR) repeat protein
MVEFKYIFSSEIRSCGKVLFIGILSIFIFSTCSIPFIGGSGENNFQSIFDNKSYLSVNEYDFREYEWNKDAKTAEEIYIRGLSDYFFKNQYDKALVIFQSSLKIYKKDAKIYTRTAECYARIGDLNQALAMLNNGANEIIGYDALPGIVRYREELNKKINENIKASAQKKRNIFIRILTYPFKIF